MIEIKITPDSPEMMAKVIALLAELGGIAPGKSAKKKPVEAPLPEIVIPAEPAVEPAAVLPDVSLEQVRASLAALSQSGKAGAVKELLSNYGASKLTEVPADKYGELLAAAEAL